MHEGSRAQTPTEFSKGASTANISAAVKLQATQGNTVYSAHLARIAGRVNLPIRYRQAAADSGVVDAH